MAPVIAGLFGDAHRAASLHDGLSLAPRDFGVTPFGEDLFDGVTETWYGALLSARPPHRGSGPGLRGAASSKSCSKYPISWSSCAAAFRKSGNRCRPRTGSRCFSRSPRTASDLGAKPTRRECPNVSKTLVPVPRTRSPSNAPSPPPTIRVGLAIGASVANRQPRGLIGGKPKITGQLRGG